MSELGGLFRSFARSQADAERLLAAGRGPEELAHLAEQSGTRSNLIWFIAINRPAPDRSKKSPIPKTVFQFWDAPDVPADVRRCIESWKPLEALGYRRILFDDQSAQAFIRDNYSPLELEAYRSCHHPAMRCDYFRLAYLARNGGLYIDADEVFSGGDLAAALGEASLLIQPLCFDTATGLMVPIRESLRRSGPTDNHFYYCNNNPLMAVANHPLIELALNRATRLITAARERHRLPDINGTTGPENMSRALFEYFIRGLDAGQPGQAVGFLTNWTSIAQSPWELSHRSDSRNWRENVDYYGVYDES